MGDFKVKVTYEYSGQPSDGKAKLKIKLEDGTVLVATDDWRNYPAVDLVLHPDHLHRRVEAVRNKVIRRFGTRHGFHPKYVTARLQRDLAVGDRNIVVTISYGRSSEGSLTMVFNSPIKELIPA